MGLASSSQGVPKGKSLLASKISTAEKTGILNISDSGIKPSSKVWTQLPLQKLKTLDVSGNPALRTLPPEIAAMSQIKVLHISRCRLVQLYDISTLTKLSVLNLNHNELSVDGLIPMGMPPQLRKLNLCSNQLATIPDAFLAGVVNLVELDLSCNRLQRTEGLGVLVSLIELKLDDNSITELSLDISLCTKLKHISLRNNKISGKNSTGEQQSIPEQVFTNTQLDEILLSGNLMLSKKMLLRFDGIDSFVERRKKSKDRNLAGGVVDDLSIFGGLE